MSSSMTHATEYTQGMTSLAQGLSFGVAGQFGQQWWEAFKPIFVRKLNDYSCAILLTSPDKNFGSRRPSANLTCQSFDMNVITLHCGHCFGNT